MYDGVGDEPFATRVFFKAEKEKIFKNISFTRITGKWTGKVGQDI